MSLQVKQRARKNPITSKEKFYLQSYRTGTVKEEALAAYLVKNTTLSPNEAFMVVREMQDAILHELLEGNSVQLGKIGSFGLNISSEGSDTAAEATLAKIKKVNVNFRCSPTLLEAAQKVPIVWKDKNEAAEAAKAVTPTP